MSKKTTFARVLSLLMISLLVLGMLPMAAIAEPVDIDLEGRSVSEEVKAPGDILLETDGYLTLEKFDPSMVDLANLRALPTQGTDVRSLTASSFDGVDKITEEELNFVEEFAEMLTDPVGIVDIEGDDDESFYVFVWLQSLPEASERIYQRHGRRNAEYERGRDNARSARSNIRANRNVDVEWEYNLVFSGFAIEATLAELEKIASMPGVFAITEVGFDEIHQYVPDPDYKIAGNKEAREIMKIGELHTAGIDGTGIKVGVIDSGIQADHPDIVNAMRGGYNFAPRANLNPGGRSPDLSTPDGMHGSHVAGTIASTGHVASLGIAPGADLWIAQVFTPQQSNSAAAADTTAALEWLSGGNPSSTYANLPVIPGGRVDVINMSMGNQANTAYEAGHVARNNAVLAGVVVVNSAGNNAYPQNNTTNRNTYTLGSGGVSLPISVAATQYGGTVSNAYRSAKASGSENLTIFVENSITEFLADGRFGNPATHEVRFTAADVAGNPDWLEPPYLNVTYQRQPLQFVAGLGYEIHWASPLGQAGTAGDMTVAQMNALKAMPADSLVGKILVVNRGQPFTEYLGEGLRLGAGAIIIINRDESLIGNMNIANCPAKHMTIMSMPTSNRQLLLNALNASADGKLYLDPGALTISHRPMEPADFSSIGPVNETAEIKPDITAPGVSILSLDLNSGYAAIGGTSMSSPWVAGAAALVLQQYPDATPSEVKARLMNTSDPDLIKPFSGRYANAGGQYFNRDGDQSSVFEQGAGFVNPMRAVYEKEFITVRNEVPTGATDRSVREADMASFSFGPQVLPQEGEGSRMTDKLTATIHGGVAADVKVIYNNNTRYSNKNLDEAVVVHFENKGDTVDVWLEIFEHASITQTFGNLYEGIIEITVAGNKKVLPWAVRTGEPPESDFWLVYFDRPVQAARGVANQDFSPYSSQNLIFFMFEGKEVMDSVQLRAATSGLINRDWFLDVYFIEWTPNGSLSHRLAINLGRTSVLQTRVLSDFLEVGTTYFVRFNGQANAINAAGQVATSVSNVPPGAYNIGFPFPGGMVDFYSVLGTVITDQRPVLTVEDHTLTNNTMSGHPYAYGTDEVTVNGRMFSAATQLAADMGYMWAGDYLMSYGMIFEVDQSLNVLVDAQTGWELEFPNPAFGGAEVPWFADEDGYFSLTLPVNDDGYFFSDDLSPSGVVCVVDAFDISHPWNANSLFMPMLYGALKSFQWLALTYEDGPEVEVTSLTLDNAAGILTATFMLQDGTVPAELDLEKLSAVLTVNGEIDDILEFVGYADGVATWTFEPVGGYYFNELALVATVTYKEFWITTSESDTDVSISIASAVPTAWVEKLNGNQNRLHIAVDVVLSNGEVIREYVTFMISNNAEANYTVGPFTIFVNTKGNDQIREIRIVSGPTLDR